MKQLTAFLSLLALLAFACQPDSNEAESDTLEAEPEAMEEAAAETATFPADSVAPDGSSYHGLRIDETGAQPLAQLPTLLATNEGESPVKLTGTLKDVCKVKGCWMTMQVAEGQEMRVRFKDYGFFVPKDASGKTAIIEGFASYDTTSVEDLRHYAVDGGMSEAEAAQKFTEPEFSLSFEATGVIIKDPETAKAGS
jgi:hypothetical protein